MMPSPAYPFPDQILDRDVMVAIIIFGVLLILIPVFIYFAQKYADLSYEELKTLNNRTQAALNKLTLLLESLDSKSSQENRT
jgi:predicted PurR-regulated permease PerM